MKKIIPLVLLALCVTGCLSNSSGEVYIAHILVSCPPKAPARVKQKAIIKIRAAYMALSADAVGFGQSASEVSDCPSKDDGGVIGWIDVESPEAELKFSPQFIQVAKTLEKGQMSEPFRTKFGFHILKCYGRR